MADECTPQYCLCWPCTCVFSFFISLFLYICFVSLIAWGMVRSNDVKFQVYDAELTHFNLENKNNLHYNLTLDLSIRNTKSTIGIHYDKFEANVYYMSQRLGAVSIPSFYQGHKNTTLVKTLFEGQNLVFLDGKGYNKFEEDQKNGVYRIDVKLNIKLRVMVLHLVTWPMKPIVRCHLKVPIALCSSNSTGGFNFLLTKCRVGF